MFRHKHQNISGLTIFIHLMRKQGSCQGVVSIAYLCRKSPKVCKSDKWGRARCMFVRVSFCLLTFKTGFSPFRCFVFFSHNINCFAKHLKFPKVTKSQKSWAMITFYFSKSHFISVTLTTFICRVKIYHLFSRILVISEHRSGQE